MFNFVWLILAAPLLASMVNGVFGRRLGKVTAAIGIAAVGVAFVESLIVAAGVLGGARADASFYGWIISGNFSVEIGYLLDPLTVVMLIVVTSVSLLVHIYSVGYMAHDRGFWRFFCYLALFTFAMLLLVLANNFLQLFIGWEGVGLCSYLLIGFWYERKSATDAAIKAFVVNRIGDFGFTIGIIFIWLTFGS
ncbi:MAG: NADH-quinone oxidoreductase subunit L, partial [Chloroflexota bacterium]|nr:NADH-quinone oxidoreductase subunit L [Chloroflexota bacterium]